MLPLGFAGAVGASVSHLAVSGGLPLWAVGLFFAKASHFLGFAGAARESLFTGKCCFGLAGIVRQWSLRPGVGALGSLGGLAIAWLAGCRTAVLVLSVRARPAPAPPYVFRMCRPRFTPASGPASGNISPCATAATSRRRGYLENRIPRVTSRYRLGHPGQMHTIPCRW